VSIGCCRNNKSEPVLIQREEKLEGEPREEKEKATIGQELKW
jgi:hypothetical protein